MAEQKQITRQRAIEWGVALFAVSFLGTVGVIWWHYHGEGMWIGVPLYIALFFSAAVMGTRAKLDEMQRNVGAGLAALIRPSGQWVLAVIVIELLLVLLCGLIWSWGCAWRWFIRSFAPLACGVLAGHKWARSQSEVAVPEKPEEKPPQQPVDFWKT